MLDGTQTMDGSDGTHNSAGSPIPGLGVVNVSAVTDHLYPLNNAIFNTDISLTNSAKKHLCQRPVSRSGRASS